MRVQLVQLWCNQCNQKPWEGVTNYERSNIHKIHRLEPQISHCFCWAVTVLKADEHEKISVKTYKPNRNQHVLSIEIAHSCLFSWSTTPSWCLHAVKTILKSWPLWDLVCRWGFIMVYPCPSISKKKPWAPWFDYVSKSQKIVDPPLGWCWTPKISAICRVIISFHGVPWWPSKKKSPGTTHGWWRGCNFFHHPWLRTQQVPVPRTNSTWHSRVGPWHHHESPAVFSSPNLENNKETMGRKPGESMKQAWSNYFMKLKWWNGILQSPVKPAKPWDSNWHYFILWVTS